MRQGFGCSDHLADERKVTLSEIATEAIDPTSRSMASSQKRSGNTAGGRTEVTTWQHVVFPGPEM